MPLPLAADEQRLRNREHALFLRDERLASGARTFKLAEGEPLPTSFGGDLYNSIFVAETPDGVTDDPKARAAVW